MLRLQRGDTIIEALLAFTVFSLVSVGAMTVMNQATNASQRSLEITLVRQQIDAQAEALRAAQQAFSRGNAGSATEWSRVATGPTTNSTVYTSETVCPAQANLSSNRAFMMNPATAAFVPGNSWYNNIDGASALPYARAAGTQSHGIWIERRYIGSGSVNIPNSYDFTIRACWFGAGMNRPMQIKTSVRLYEPR